MSSRSKRRRAIPRRDLERYARNVVAEAVRRHRRWEVVVRLAIFALGWFAGMTFAYFYAQDRLGGLLS